jgi:hypothetical protein
VTYHPDPAELVAFENLYGTLARLVDQAARSEGKAPSEFSILELGPGRGEMMRILGERGYQVTGLDIDPECVKLSSRYGKCELGLAEDIPRMFRDGQFDLVIASHVIEHLERPLDVVRGLSQVSGRWVLLAVPNPMRPMVVFKSLLRRDWSNSTHVVTWDHSHFRVFLRDHAGLEIVDEGYDLVGLAWGFPRRLLQRAGLLRPLNWLESKVMTRLIPRFSMSVIELAQVSR